MDIFAPVLAIFGFVATPGGVAHIADRAHAPAVHRPAVAAKSKNHSPYSSNPAYDVYVDGQYVGSDPDPRVRDMIWREGHTPNNNTGRSD
jgi:hypothetical protein